MKSFGSFPKAVPPVAPAQSSSKRPAIEAPFIDKRIKKQKKAKSRTTESKAKNNDQFIISRTGDPVYLLFLSLG
jgi:hypothetical protein